MAIILRPDIHIGVCGVTGSGKSTLFSRLILPALRKIRGQVLVIIDIKDEYGEAAGVTVETPADLNDALYAKDKPAAKVIRVRPTMDATQAYAEELLRSAWAPYMRNMRGGGRYVPTFPVRVIIDDVTAWYSETGGRGGEEIMRRYCTLGRGVGGPKGARTVTWLAQRLTLVPKIATTQASILICCSMAPYDILNSIDKQYSVRIGNAVRALPRYGYAILSDELPGFIEIYNPIKGKFPARPGGVDLDEMTAANG
jgi:hypothetical protein